MKLLVINIFKGYTDHPGTLNNFIYLCQHVLSSYSGCLEGQDMLGRNK